MLHTSSRKRIFVWSCVAVAILANTAGYVWDLYDRWWWFDEVLHGYTIFAITLLLGLLLYGFVLTGKSGYKLLLILMIASLGIAVGAVWEIAEWFFDQLVTGNVILGKTDTIIDMIVDSLGALLAGILSVVMIRS